MKLDRNLNKDGKGKYALVNLRTGKTEYVSDKENEFFVIKLKDKYAETALRAYAEACKKDDPEYSQEIIKLAEISAKHPSKKIPD